MEVSRKGVELKSTNSHMERPMFGPIRRHKEIKCRNAVISSQDLLSSGIKNDVTAVC